VSVVPDIEANLTYDEAVEALHATSSRVAMQLPAYLEADLPATQRWWYRIVLEKKREASWLRLPVGMHDARLFFDGDEVDLAAFRVSGELIAPRVRIPERFDSSDRVEVVVALSVPRGHYDGEGWGTIGLTGGMGIGYSVEEERIESVERSGRHVRVTTNHRTYNLEVGMGGDA
jgi:hypothetical protein